MDEDILTHVLGIRDDGRPLRDQVRASRRLFVRDQDHISLANDGAKGRRLTAFEALEAFGEGVFQEIYDYGSAILPVERSEPARSLKKQRESLGLTIDQLARRTKLEAAKIRDAESPDIRSPFRILERIAVALGLDERYLSVRRGAGGDAELAFRLKRLRGGTDSFSDAALVNLSQAAWVIRTQHRLQSYFGYGFKLPEEISPSSNYGQSGYPAWQHGYFLAGRTREALSLSTTDPIESLRDVCFDLRIPLILATLPHSFAGATVEVGGVRGIVINTVGENENVWVRRATIAHELGHLLWDPVQQLKNLRVDVYGDLKKPYRDAPDSVESRANAFAIEFLAPHREVAVLFESKGGGSIGLQAVMDKFGVSMTAARYHLSNALERPSILKLKVEDNFPGDEWIGRESYTNEYFPLDRTPQIKRGEFAGWVVAAERARFLSLDSAATYLSVETAEYLRTADQILDLFPGIRELCRP